ncbi:hypothetical protein [Myxacorys almedinensis]|nr:hypothetical protein [Myxacorys almedinensis]
MNEWQKEFSETLETMVGQVEDFLTEFAHNLSEVVQTYVEVSEQVSTQLNGIFVDEVEQYITGLVSPVLEAYFGIESLVEEAAQPVFQTVDPLLKQHLGCVGCRHFHGQIYGDTLLVCGMHPYGIDEGVETCPDKEATVWKSPGFAADGRFFFGSHEDW